jgi:hypothetical protein
MTMCSMRVNFMHLEYKRNRMHRAMSDGDPDFQPSEEELSEDELSEDGRRKTRALSKKWTETTADGTLNEYSYKPLTAWQFYLKLCEWSQNKIGANSSEIEAWVNNPKRQKPVYWDLLVQWKDLKFKPGMKDMVITPGPRPDPMPTVQKFIDEMPNPPPAPNPNPVLRAPHPPSGSALPAWQAVKPVFDKNKPMVSPGNTIIKGKGTFANMLLIMVFYREGVGGSSSPVGVTEFEDAKELMANLMLLELFRSNPGEARKPHYKAANPNHQENLFKYYWHNIIGINSVKPP